MPGAALSVELACAALDLLLPATEQPLLYWSFTGGEALSLGADWFQAVLAHGERVASASGRRVQWELQSNLLLLDRGLLSLLDRHHVRLGTSIDGPPSLQELHRPGSAETIVAWQRLADQGRPPGVLCVLSAESWRRRCELADFFASLEVPVLKLAPLRPVGRGADLPALTARMLMDIRLELIQRLLDGSYLHYDPDLHLYLRCLYQQRPPGTMDCSTVRCGAGKISISVDVDGSLHPCIQPARVRQHPMGTVQEGLWPHSGARLAGFFGSDAWTVRCFSCEAHRICFFGCRAVAIATEDQMELECDFTRLLWDYLKRHPRQASRLYERLETMQRRLDQLELSHPYLPDDVLDQGV